jgi:hypothetical protein
MPVASDRVNIVRALRSKSEFRLQPKKRIFMGIRGEDLRAVSRYQA